MCRAHGGAAPQVRAKAQVRILMSADAAAAKLIEMIHSKKVDDRTKLLAVKDLLDRANLSGTQNIEVGVTKRTFEDFIGDALVDLGDEDVVDAEIVAEVTERTERELERWEREDAQSERQRENKRLTAGSRPTPPRNPERDRAEAAAIRAHRDEPEDDGLSTPDKFGVRRDTSAERAARSRNAKAMASDDKTVRAPRSTSTADPYADRYESRGSRRSMSPKRYEARQNDRD